MGYLIESFADFTSGLELEKLPPEIVTKIKTCVMDAVENIFTDMADVRTDAAFNSIRKSEALPATVVGTDKKASSEDAAFYNTVKGALTSRNDSSRTAICHPGSILVPVCLALGEEYGKSGRDMIEALIAGYETMIRLGTCFVKSGINNSWRKTSIVAAFGAAFSAARMAGLSKEMIASSASFACHFAGGVNEWAVAGTGEDVFQNGWGARNGILAMRLAASGAPGCRSILEGESGLLNAFGAGNLEALQMDSLGNEYLIRDIMFKPLNSCFIVQGACQTAMDVVLSMPDGYNPMMIERIEVSMPAQGIDYPGCNNTEAIESLVQGIMSIALGVCSVLYFKTTEDMQWAPPINPDVIELMHRTVLIKDQEKTAAFPGLQGSMVKVAFNDGSEYVADHPDVIPLTDKQVREKFLRTVCRRIGEEQGRKLYSLIDNLESIEDIHEITKLFPSA